MEFFEGDIVRIVEEPYEECAFGWAPGMDDFCGKEYVINKKEWSDFFDLYVYTLCDFRGIPQGFSWCEGCFNQPAPDFPIADESSVNDLLGLGMTQ